MEQNKKVERSLYHPIFRAVMRQKSKHNNKSIKSIEIVYKFTSLRFKENMRQTQPHSDLSAGNIAIIRLFDNTNVMFNRNNLFPRK